MSNSPFRAYCFTVNNPDGLLDWDDFPDYARCLIYQEETGANGTHHFQGYLECSKPVRITALKKIPGLERAHFEKRRGTRAEAIAYCRKQDETYVDGPYEYGDFEAGGQGSRNDYTTLKKLVDQQASDKILWDQVPDLFLRFHTAIPKVRLLSQPQRNFMTKVYVLWGETETGKTSWAVMHSGRRGATLYFKQRSNWWDNYNGHDDVILDDFYGWIKYDELLRLCDRYPCQVEIKGSHTVFAPQRIYITSNKRPQEWYKEQCNFSAFARRVHKWLSFSQLGRAQVFLWNKTNQVLDPGPVIDIEPINQ